MKNVSIKKSVVVLTALLLVGVLVVCVACQDTVDPYAGNYQTVAAEDRNEVVTDTTAKLEEINENGLQHIEFTYKLNSSTEEDGETTAKNNTKVKLLVDGKKLYSEIDYDETKNGETTKFKAKVWYDDENEEAWYKVVVDGETFEGQYTSSTTGDEIQMALIITVLLAPNMVTVVLGQFTDALQDSATELYADGNKLKIVADTTEENETNKGEGYMIFAEDGAFRFKLENTSKKTVDTKTDNEQTFAEIVSTTKTVTMPASK